MECLKFVALPQTEAKFTLNRKVPPPTSTTERRSNCLEDPTIFTEHGYGRAGLNIVADKELIRSDSDVLFSCEVFGKKIRNSVYSLQGISSALQALFKICFA